MGEKFPTRKYREENKFGVMKTRFKVQVGTSIIDVPWELRNPVTERYHRVDKLSNDGYLLGFLTVLQKMKKGHRIDLHKTNMLTFDKDKWELSENDSCYVIESKE